MNIYEKQLANFKNIKKNISSKGSFSEFDVIFIKNYDYFLKKASNAMSLLKDLFKNPECSRNFELLCHNNIKEETAVKYNGTTSLISFENISKGLFISDFSDIINRYVRKSSFRYGNKNFAGYTKISCKIYENLLRFLLKGYAFRSQFNNKSFKMYNIPKKYL